MKICMIGLGSIGKRHLKNIVKAMKKRKREYQIDALRSSCTALQGESGEIICHQYYKEEDLPEDYDIIFVTNPTFLHYDTIQKTIAKTKHMFIEKPIFDSLNYDLKLLSLRNNAVYYVACPLRHKTIMKYVKYNILSEESVLSARIISTSYLPMWRKDIDYRYIYSARKDMGGGVTRDLIHEWDYALYLFGNPQKVLHLQDHVSDLEIDSDDLSVYIAKYPDMILEIHLDYIGRKTERILQLFTNNKRIDIDLTANEICEYIDHELVIKQEFPEEDYYMNEMEYFLDCIDKRKPNVNTIENAYNTLKIALTEE